jgi:murein DD-endopeptidase MepM/ murein hydrolase activator NlpD
MKNAQRKVNQGKKKKSVKTQLTADNAAKQQIQKQERAAAAAAQPKSAAKAQTARKTAAKPETEKKSFALIRTKAQRVRHLKLRWHHIVREHRAHHFPESDKGIAQFVLFAMGILPLAGSRIREKTQFRRSKAARSQPGRLRVWLENRKSHPVAFLAAACSAAAILLFFSFYTLGTTVTYQGKVIGTTTSPLAVKSACADLEKVTEKALDKEYTLDIAKLKYTSKLMSRRDVVSADTFEENLSAQIGKVTYGYALYIDGEMIGATPYKGTLEELLQQLKDDVTDKNTISCDFREDVKIKAEYVPNDKIMNLGYLAETLYSTKKKEVTYTVKDGDTWSEIAEAHDMTSKELLAMNPGFDVNKLQIGEVLTLSAASPYLTMTVVEKETYKEAIPYDIKYVDSVYLFKGDTKVLSAGKNGSANVVAKVTYVNGEETKRDVLSYVKTDAPVTETQARGTKERPTWTATGTFRWPCSGNVTSKFGYRHLSYSYASTNHKGIDIANRRGTPICAADGGTVTYSGWMSGYGYLVIINHGNGYETYYGHNSELLVSVGQHVYRGQQISKMGSTGNSTGNHCHFGVYYHGVPKNPLNYL